jgi:hypothetical protein
MFQSSVLMLITSSVRKQLTKALALRTLANSAALVHEYLKLSQLYCQNSPHQEVRSDINLTGVLVYAAAKDVSKIRERVV